MEDKFFLNKKKKSPEIKIKNMGVDIDKNEYREIVLSNSAHPEASFYDIQHIRKLLFMTDINNKIKSPLYLLRGLLFIRVSVK